MAVVLARVVILPSCELTDRRHVVACRCCVLSGRKCWPDAGAVGSFQPIQHVNVNNISIMSNLMIRTNLGGACPTVPAHVCAPAAQLGAALTSQCLAPVAALVFATVRPMMRVATKVAVRSARWLPTRTPARSFRHVTCAPFTPPFARLCSVWTPPDVDARPGHSKKPRVAKSGAGGGAGARGSTRTPKPRARSKGGVKAETSAKASAKAKVKAKNKAPKAKAKATSDKSCEAGRFIPSKMHDDGKLRCWSMDEMIHYHDEEWGFPCTDSTQLFAQMTLQAFQVRARAKPVLCC